MLGLLVLLGGAGPPGASACSGCHSVRGPVPGIAGRPVGEIVEAMGAFRSGARQGTVMNRIAPGFSVGETAAIAAWWSAQTGAGP